MSIPAILTIDEGTTGVTCLVVTKDGDIVAREYSEFTQHFPRPGWVEHDAAEIWDVAQRLARAALEGAANSDADVQGIGITNQRETLVVWDRETLDPVHRAIVWQDRRTTDICARLKEEGYEGSVRKRTGLRLDPYFTGTKLTWLLEQRPELRRRAEDGQLAMGTIDSWLIAKLTEGAVHATDPTNASRTLLYGLQSLDWVPELLDTFGVPAAMLPEILPSSGTFGISTLAAIGAELPIAGVAGDQQAALFGQGCWRAGLAKNTYGTGAFMLLHTGQEIVYSKSGLLTTVACSVDGGTAYALEGSIFIAGAALQWLRDGVGVLETAEESESMARSLESNDGVYMVPAFVGLGAPYWEPNARGTITGLNRGTTKAHLVRAALEAMAYGTAEVIGAMENDSGVPTRELRVDGGAALNDWLMEFQAGVLDVPVRRPEQVETTALGAAGLAGIATGVWAGAEDFLASLGDPDIFEPEMDRPTRQTLLDGWKRAVQATISWADGAS